MRINRKVVAFNKVVLIMFTYSNIRSHTNNPNIREVLSMTTTPAVILYYYRQHRLQV